MKNVILAIKKDNKKRKTFYIRESVIESISEIAKENDCSQNDVIENIVLEKIYNSNNYVREKE